MSLFVSVRLMQYAGLFLEYDRGKIYEIVIVHYTVAVTSL